MTYSLEVVKQIFLWRVLIKDVEIGDLYIEELFQTMDECFAEFAMKFKKNKAYWTWSDPPVY